jgi:hypothetical protein
MSSGGRLASDRWGSIALAAFVALAGAGRVAATEPGYELTLGVGESDNVARVPGGPSSTIVMEGAEVTWHDQRPRLNADVDGDLQYLTYFPRDFHSQVVGNFLGDLRATAIPQLLYWDLSDNFGQGRIDPLAPVSPLNLENINYFNTGPELLVPLSATNILDVAAHFSNVNYQRSPLNNNRYDGKVAFVHELSQQSSLSLNVTDERVDFKDTVLNQDYSRQDAFVRFDTRSARTTIGIDLGYSRLQNPLEPSSGVLARAQLSRKLSASSTLALSGGRQYSDAASAFLLGQALGGANLATQTSTQSSAPFTSDYGSLAWNFQRNRTGLGLGVTEYKDSYQPLQSAENDRRTQLDGHFSRTLSPTLTALLQDQYFRQVFEELSDTATENDVNLQLIWRASRQLSVTLDLAHSNRHSNIANTEFTENRVWLTLGYGRPAQTPPGPPTPRLPNQKLMY